MEEKLLQQLLTEFRELKNTVEQRFDGIDKQFQGIEKKFDGIDQKFQGIDKRFEEMEKRLDGLATGQKELYLLTRTLEERTAVISSTVTRL